MWSLRARVAMATPFSRCGLWISAQDLLRMTLSIMAMMVMAGGGAGCTRRLTIPGTVTLPSAMAQILFKTDANNNMEVRLFAEHMAPPQRIRQDLNTDVVWVSSVDSRQFTRHGAFVVGKNRRGDIRFVTPLDRFVLMVTVEPQATVEKPGEVVVFHALIDTSS